MKSLENLKGSLLANNMGVNRYSLLCILLLRRAQLQALNELVGVEHALSTLLERSERDLKMKEGRLLPKAAWRQRRKFLGHMWHTLNFSSDSFPQGWQLYTPRRKARSRNHT